MVKKLSIIFVLFWITLLPIHAQYWNQLGEDIDGSGALDHFGKSVSMSSDGLTVATGSNLGGYTRVHKYILGAWVQQGGDINELTNLDYTGNSVSLSADGLTLAVGSPRSANSGNDRGDVRIFNLIGSTWTQLGANLTGNQGGDWFGHSVSLSSDGLTVVIGAPFEDGGAPTGYAKIYKYILGTWVEQVQIDGVAMTDQFGYSVSMSDDGLTVAIGAKNNEGNGVGIDAGQVRVYRNISGSTWIQQGVALNGEAVGDHSGTSVSLNADGSIVAIGAPSNDAGGNMVNSRGHTRVYQFITGAWTQLGSDIDGEAAGDGSGGAVSLSDDGLTVAIGATGSDGNGTNSGHARRYQFTSSSWSKIGADIDGDYQYDSAGESVSLSSDGVTIAIGAIGNDGGGTSSGQVRVFSFGPYVYRCISTVTTFPYNQDFEGFSYCSDTPGMACELSEGWKNSDNQTPESNDDIDWTNHDGPTNSTWTGPSVDYNPGTVSGNFLYTEAHSGYNSTAIVTSPCFDLTSVTLTELAFSYHMYGVNMGTMNVDISTDLGANYTNVWSLSGDQGDVWNRDTIDLSAYDGQLIKVRFRGITGSSFRSDMAIDDITVQSNEICVSGATNGGDTEIDNVTFNTINQSSANNCVGYTDYTSISTNVTKGLAYNLSISTGDCDAGGVYQRSFSAYIDWNGDLDFDDAGETVFTQSYGSVLTGNTSVTIPASATEGTTIMRIVCMEGGVAQSCGTYPFGETEDYTINILAPCFSSSTDVVTACDSYLWIDGNTYTSNNSTATHVLVNGNANGCDSTITLNLTINATSSTDVQTACDSYLWIDGNTYTTSNSTATHTLTNANNCDSVVTLNLTINNATIGTDVQTACGSYLWIDGNTYTSNNSSATYTLTNAAGCDSVVTLNLTFNNATVGTDIQTACDSYLWIDGNTYTSNNSSATHTLTNAVGCDSVVTLNLTINNSSTSTDVQTACDSYLWIDGNTYTTSNSTATHTLINAAGCDSVVTLNLSMTICPGNECSTAIEVVVAPCGGSHTETGSTVGGTPSTEIPCVITLGTGGANWYTFVGDGGTWTVSSVNPGTNYDTKIWVYNGPCGALQCVTGNDDFGILPESEVSFSTVIGTDYYVVIGGFNASEGSYELTFSNVGGGNPTNGTDVINTCDSHTWIDGNTYISSNSTATHTIVNGATSGCDSIVTLNLTINNSTNGTDVINTCDSHTWIDGNTYTSSNNTTTHTIVNGAANGCDSIVTLDLTILSNSSTDVQIACESYTWIDGNTYTSSNSTATHTLVGGNANGCDSIVTLNLTINNADTNVTIASPMLTATATVASYRWLDCDNSIAVIPGATNQSYTATANGNFAVEITQNGCIDTSSCYSIVGIGINENSFMNSFVIYPNPTNNQLTITINKINENTTVVVYNAVGKEIISKNLKTNQTKIDLTDYEKGIYFIKIQNRHETITEKVIKK